MFNNVKPGGYNSKMSLEDKIKTFGKDSKYNIGTFDDLFE
jgi:hypothetical protein